MAKNGFSVMDSDMHIVEPNDLFERYLDAPYKHQAPKITRVRGQRVGIFLFEGHAFPTVDVDQPRPQRWYGRPGRRRIKAHARQGVHRRVPT